MIVALGQREKLIIIIFLLFIMDGLSLRVSSK